MKKAFLLLVFLISFLQWQSNAQIENPVKWSYSIKALTNNEALLIFEATIEPKWHLYSQFFPDGGPIKLTFNFQQSRDFQLVGKVEESPKPKAEYDDVFEIEVKYFVDKATFTQKIKINSEKDFSVKGEIGGQACSEVDGRCIPLNPAFEFKVKGLIK